MHISRAVWAAGLFSLIQPVFGQHSVPPEYLYERLICVVPIVGKGARVDPKRPMYAPLPSALNPASATTILAFTQVLSDDGNFALVQFAARDRAAVKDILADKSVKAFLKGRDARADVEFELKKFKKNFDFKLLELRVQ